MSGRKGHLDSDRMDSVTILPPPGVAERAAKIRDLSKEDLVGVRLVSSEELRPNYILCLRDLQAPPECPHLDHLVDYVHDL